MNKPLAILTITALMLIVGCGSSIPVDYKPMPVSSGNEFNNFYVKKDDFRGVDFIRHISLFDPAMFNTWTRKSFIVYIASQDDNHSIRIQFRYMASDWVFYDKVILKNEKGEQMVWVMKSWDKTTDVGGGMVYENYDASLSPVQLSELEALLRNGQDIKYRFTGKYYDDFVMPPEVKKGIIKTIEYYRSLFE
jgi:hypothetical protein